MPTLNLGRVGFVNKGAWSVATAYKINDIVTYNNGTYAALQAHTGQTPIAGGSAYWQEWVTQDNSTFVADAIHSSTPQAAPLNTDEFGYVSEVSPGVWGLVKMTYLEMKTALASVFAPIASPSFTGAVSVESSIIFEGSTADAFETTLTAIDPTADNTVTIPNRSFTIAGTDEISGKPACSVYLGVQQAITSGVWTKIPFSAEDYDTTAAFDSTTNFRYTPLVSGKYHVDACTTLNGVGSTRAGIRIYKNGVLAKQGNTAETPSTNTDQIRSVSIDIGMNGTTDYLEAYAFINGTSTVIAAGSEYTYFNAHLVIGA